MAKFDMGAAWDDSMNLLRSHSALTGTIAAVFLFLPALAVSWFGPVPIEPPTGATMDQILATLRESARQALPYQLLITLISAIGGVGILRLWLSRTGISVGEALVFAIKMVPTVIGVQIIMGVGIALAALVLVLPGVAAAGSVVGALLIFAGLVALLVLVAYMWARLSVVSPVIADRTTYNPIVALQQSWALTRGNAGRIFLFLFLVLLVIIVAALLLGGIAALVGGAGEGAGRLVGGLVEGAVAAVGGLVTLAITAATYRQLAVGGAESVFS